MQRDWLTLAFGVGIVGLVVALSLRQNLIERPSDRTPAADAPPAATAPADAPASAPATAVPSPSAPSEPAASPPAKAASGPRPKPNPAGPASTPETPAPAENVATLQVSSDIAGASVFVDREFVGTTPLTLRDLPPGSRQLNVTATGHEGYSDTIALAAGPNRVNVEFMKVRLNASVPVVHRHAMGSCQGMLVASAKGLSYDTANKADAFMLSLNDVDEFEVDYLKKNLRVRRREGKTWNFTNDNADALFVFHRDVAKARERLAATR